MSTLPLVTCPQCFPNSTGGFEPSISKKWSNAGSLTLAVSIWSNQYWMRKWDLSDGEGGGRHRSGSSTTIYNPEEHGHSPNLPAIEVQDLTGDNDVSPIEQEKPILAHTTRPPVELMEQ